MTTANTLDCFRTFIGQKVVGFISDALPIGRNDLAAGSKTFIFEDGRGLTIGSNGSYWVEDAETVTRAVSIVREQLENTKMGLEHILTLTGRA